MLPPTLVSIFRAIARPNPTPGRGLGLGSEEGFKYRHVMFGQDPKSVVRNFYADLGIFSRALRYSGAHRS
ncbi:MAG: hypothetical protein ACI9MR_005111 [Myxococcota bacterium]|jgi:hypothetical protein